MTYRFLTLGCKVNQFETQAMETLLRAHGAVPATDAPADAVIVNTCAVTAESGRKSCQTIRREMNANPGAVLAVCGCFSQIEPDRIAALGADVIFGSGDRGAFVAAVERAVEARERTVFVDDPFRRRVMEPLPAGALQGRTRAYLKIEDGCDNFCAYCVIPYARGRVRSMPLADAAAESRRLCAEGFREIVVTGIEISSYGKDLGEARLGDVIRTVAEAAPGVRIHIGSLEPTVVTDAFCVSLAGCGNINPHFHLSLQSGCDRTLARMNRKYDTAMFRAAAERLRARFPGCALTADLITGFPGETEEDHLATLAFIREIGFSAMHVFPYSVRKGTKAAAMPDQLTNAVKQRRAAEAQAAAAEMRAAYLAGQVGKTRSVLFETRRGEYWGGHTENYCEVLSAGEDLHGVVAPVRIERAEDTLLYGKLV